MFSIKRVEEGEECRVEMNVPEGHFSVVGESEFVVEIFKAVCENDYFAEILRKTFAGATIEEVAEKMRAAGFPEQIVIDFEKGDFWSDVIKTKNENGR